MDKRGDALDAKILKEEKQLRKLKIQIDKARGPAKKRLKMRAMQVVRRKRQYEKQRDHIYSQAFNLSNVSEAIDQMNDTKDTVSAMKDANKVLKKEFKKISIDDLDDLQDDMSDMLEDVDEIQEALGRSYGNVEDIDEDELDAELDAFGDDVFDELDEIGEEAEGEGEHATYLDEGELPDVPKDEFGMPLDDKTKEKDGGGGALSDASKNAVVN